MCKSKLLPPFAFDVLRYFDRDKLERLSIVCRPLKNFILEIFQSKPYRVFDQLLIRRGSYALVHKLVQWRRGREDYSVQQFLAGQEYVDESRAPCDYYEYFSFAETRPYLGPSVRITKWTSIYVAGDSTYTPEHIAEMESIAHLWRDGKMYIQYADYLGRRIVAEDFLPVLNSLSILYMINALFSFKNYKVLYSVKVIEIRHSGGGEIDLWQQCWLEFFEQPGVKPVVVFHHLRRDNVNKALDRLSKVI